jgi:environmental stress-induced protein Ves
MKTIMIKSHQLKSSSWSGGTTTQMDIFPETAVYGDRDFIFRVSSATIEESPSAFTPLPDYQRWIAMLSSPVVLEHDAAFRVPLEPFEVYHFDGGRQTRSVGQARDFNLMLRKGLYGWMKLLRPEVVSKSGQKWLKLVKLLELGDREPDHAAHLAMYYPVQLSLDERVQIVTTVRFGQQDQVLSPGDYLRLSGTVSELMAVEISMDPSGPLFVLYMET